MVIVIPVKRIIPYEFSNGFMAVPVGQCITDADYCRRAGKIMRKALPESKQEDDE